VPAHPDIRERYLAVDVLVTDYSSAMFDFAVTGRPVLLFTYDLADYRDRLRVFYLDLDAVTAAHADRLARFRRTFDPYDDEHATDRVLDLFFPTRAAAPAASASTDGGGRRAR
jgi:CDP-glycerol glycerophosphotransferase (TagB/SpsB family)